jgi:hypothetical protein
MMTHIIKPAASASTADPTLSRIASASSVTNVLTRPSALNFSLQPLAFSIVFKKRNLSKPHFQRAITRNNAIKKLKRQKYDKND